MILGCKHYKRNAKLKAACCGRLFPCRLCHDDVVKDHKIDRYATESMFCMLCKKMGDIGQNCEHCGQSMGRYYCAVCKFIDDDAEKKIFHCVPCGLCRIGTLGVDVAHCDACGVCFATLLFLSSMTHPNDPLNLLRFAWLWIDSRITST